MKLGSWILGWWWSHDMTWVPIASSDGGAISLYCRARMFAPPIPLGLEELNFDKLVWGSLSKVNRSGHIYAKSSSLIHESSKEGLPCQ